MTTALVYVRQSRNRESERTLSPEVQEAACRALPAVQRCERVEVFTDLDVSGGKRARRGYDAMMARIRSGDVAVVAAYDLSRAFRSTLMAAEFKALLEAPTRAMIQVVFAHGSFDRSPVGGFSYAVLAAAHEMERKMVGEKIREAKRFAASRGEMVGAVPLGYRWHGEGRERKLVIDEDWAPLVRRIFDEYATARFSTRDIAARLNTEGVRPPRFTGGWRADTIAQLLGNLAYRGLTYSERRSKRQGELIAANWPAIIDEPVWAAVDRLLSRYHRKGGRHHQGDDSEGYYAFQGLLRCDRCGERLHTQRLRRNRGGHAWSRTYYRCIGRAASGHPECGIALREDGLLVWARDLIEFLSRSEPAEVGAALAREADRPPFRSPEAVDRIDAQLARVGQRFEWGELTDDEYRGKREWLVAQRREHLAVQSAPAAASRLTGLLDAWDRADALGRRELLATLFVELDVRGGEIWRGLPRPEVAADLAAHLRDWNLPGFDLKKLDSECSPGGIRTRDLSLERAAS